MLKTKKILVFTLISALLLSGIPFPYQTADASLTVEYLIVSGGGGGGQANLEGASGGGGAGAFRSGSGYSVTEGTDYTVTVGAGGAVSSNGGSSTFDTITVSGGGRGGNGVAGGGSSSDGSGGGGGGDGSSSGGGWQGGAGGSSGSYGNNGGQGGHYYPNAQPAGGGAGGGASQVGEAGRFYHGGDGGDGIASSISGSSVTYAGGGGGGGIGGGTNGDGGAGGGASGSWGANSGTANTGGGGGGRAHSGLTANGGAGGSGIVIIKYLTNSLTATGGTITTDGSYTIHTFTSSGTFSVQSPVPSPPLNPSLTTLSTSSMLFDWDAPTDGDNITGYKIWNNTDGSVILNDTATSDTQYTLTGLKSGSLQNLIVSAWNGTGAGENSTSVSNYTINTPPVLDSVNVYNSTAFELSYTINGTFNGIRIDGEEFGSSVTTLLANSTSSSATYIVGGITEAIDTAITIFALNLGGTSEVSNEITNATASTSAPSLETSQGLGSAVDLTITAPVNGTATYYDILRTNSTCTSFTTIESGVTNLITTDSSTEPGTLYCYQVVAVNQYGSTNSGNSTITTGIASSGGGGGGAGGGQSGNPDSDNTSELLSMQLSAQSNKLTLGEVKQSSLSINWNLSKDIQVNKILVGDSPLRVSFPVTPFKLIGDESGFSSAEIGYTLKVPENLCSDTLTINCVEFKEYQIPVTVLVLHEGLTIPVEAPITADLTETAQFGFLIVVGLIGMVVSAIAYKTIKGRGSRKSNGTKRSSTKSTKKSSSSNGTKRTSLSKKS